jgi:choline dehydrogenase-like flavoprotein
MANSVTFEQRKPVDFAIIGSGAAGGIIAKELSTAGFNVVVFEQGPYRRAEDFTHDEYSVVFNSELLGGGPEVSGQTFRHDEDEVATSPPVPPIGYAQTVGGSSVHFSANFRLQGTQHARFNQRHQLC